jgi:hypothetical protein
VREDEMRRAVAILAVLAMAVTAQGERLAVDNATVSVTDTNTIVPFKDDGSGGTGANFSARQIIVRSATASTDVCYFDFNDTTASTADIAVEPGATVHIDAPEGHEGFPGIGAICGTGDTATFYVTATR